MAIPPPLTHARTHTRKHRIYGSRPLVGLAPTCLGQIPPCLFTSDSGMSASRKAMLTALPTHTMLTQTEVNMSKLVQMSHCGDRYPPTHTCVRGSHHALWAKSHHAWDKADHASRRPHRTRHARPAHNPHSTADGSCHTHHACTKHVQTSKAKSNVKLQQTAPLLPASIGPIMPCGPGPIMPCGPGPIMPGPGPIMPGPAMGPGPGPPIMPPMPWPVHATQQ